MSLRHNLRHAAILLAFAASPAGAQSFEDLMRTGRSQLQAGKADDAVASFEKAVAANDKSADAHTMLGNALGTVAQNANVFRQGLLARRVKSEFEKAVALDPSLVQPREGLVQFYTKAPGVMGGSMDKAKEQAAAIAKLNPISGHLAEANIALTEKDALRAEKAYAAAVAENPDSLRALNAYVNFLVNNKRADEAFPHVDRYLAKHPSDRVAQFYVGRLAATTGKQLDRGEQLLRTLLANPVDSGPRVAPENIHFRLGDILAKKGDKVKARAEYEEALKVNPNFEPVKKALKAL